jgi:hypothetical protein
MTARLLVLPAVYAALFAVSGPHAHGDLPVAPAPRAKPEKRWAELIVGTWREATFNGMPVPFDRAARIEFTPDGRFVVRVNDPQSGNVGMKSGTYTLRGDALCLTSRAKADAGASWAWKVVSLTGETLVTAEQAGGDSRRDVAHEREKR